MNSPFVVEQARQLLNRPEILAHTEPERRIEALYRLLYGRGAETEEVSLGRRFLAAAATQDKEKLEPSAKPLTAWEKYAQVLLLSNEFAFVD